MPHISFSLLFFNDEMRQVSIGQNFWVSMAGYSDIHWLVIHNDFAPQVTKLLDCVDPEREVYGRDGHCQFDWRLDI